ncbi:p-nitrophenyl phosphatase [Friedmanniomyces endolithicus]|nr:p-nitrophenyl phosphatase [Friedmanniomyces endolithicus]KAK0784077.1 p-nitrophenyl phosphatase [Friedmanniomyces endolithicus]KAK0863004.1 p-nitrophenyl phosphatase [Friedmanniomyces endolithicus]KAK0881486.1 p-nitrophenyl phosphatase [Friedmanniomyces endolithicus]
MSLVNLSHVCSHLQNASLARLGLTSIPYTKLHLSLALLLHKQGFLSQVKLGGPSPPASCFPAPLADNHRITGAPHRDRDPRSGEAALHDMVYRRKTEAYLREEGFGEEAVEFALEHRQLGKEQLEQDGWDKRAIDFLLKHGQKPHAQLEEEGFDSAARTILQDHDVPSAISTLRTQLAEELEIDENDVSKEQLEPRLRAHLRREGFPRETLAYFAGPTASLATPRHLERDGIALTAMGLTVPSQPFTTLPPASRDPDALESESEVTRANRASRRLWLGLKYWDGSPVLSKARMVSKPTKRYWLDAWDLGKVVRGGSGAKGERIYPIDIHQPFLWTSVVKMQAVTSLVTGSSSGPQFLTGDKPAIDAFIAKFDVFLFDCDGVLWSGDHLFPLIPETIAHLRSLQKRLIFVTNNSTKSRADYAKKFHTMGIPCSEEEVFGSSYSAAIYIARIMRLEPPKNRVYVLGESGVEQELASENIPFCGGTDPLLRREMLPEDFKRIADGSLLDDDVAIVLTGLDYHPSYLKYALGMAYLRRGAHFLATNTDSTLPSAGTLFPGAGATSAPLVTAAGKQPLALGKPGQAMMEAIEGKFAFERARACMVGDRLDTDIRFGIEGGLGGTLCVLTGVSRKEEFLGKGKGVVPSAYLDSLGDLLG